MSEASTVMKTIVLSETERERHLGAEIKVHFLLPITNARKLISLDK